MSIFHPVIASIPAHSIPRSNLPAPQNSETILIFSESYAGSKGTTFFLVYNSFLQVMKILSLTERFSAIALTLFGCFHKRKGTRIYRVLKVTNFFNWL